MIQTRFLDASSDTHPPSFWKGHDPRAFRFDIDTREMQFSVWTRKRFMWLRLKWKQW